MPQTTGSLHNGKPIVEVAIAQAIPIPNAVVPQASAAIFPVRHYKALLDTGADITCLCDHVVRECGLRSYGLANLIGGNGSNKHTTHIVRIGIFCEETHDFEGENHVTKTLFRIPEPVDVVAIRDNGWFDVIIGTDILTNYEFRLLKGGRFALILD
jgi:hypothetical protein